MRPRPNMFHSTGPFPIMWRYRCQPRWEYSMPCRAGLIASIDGYRKRRTGTPTACLIRRAGEVDGVERPGAVMVSVQTLFLEVR